MKKNFFNSFIFLLLLTFFIACNDKKETLNHQSNENITLHLQGGNSGVLDPYHHIMRGPGIFKMQLIYDSLLEKGETGDIPWLAKNWDTNDDGTIFTFHLVDNAKWHDGKPLTAEDVAFTFNYYKKHLPLYHSLVSNGEYIVKNAKVIDTNTVEIELKHFSNTALSSIGNARILPKHIWEKVENPLEYSEKDAIIGSGPFKLESCDVEKGAYKLVKFDEYWGKKQGVDAIEWLPITDPTFAFEKGEIDLIYSSPDLLERYSKDKNYKIKSVSSLHSYRIMMNMEKSELLKNKNIRQAIAYAINRENIINTVMRGNATLSSYGYVPMDSPWYNPNTNQYEQNIEKSKELLDNKNYSFDLQIGNSPEEVKIAELLKMDLEKVGITLNIKSIESKTRDANVQNGNYELALIYYGNMGGDPNYLSSFYGKNATVIKGWKNQEIFDLLDSQIIEKDTAKRKELINKTQELISEEVPMILLVGAIDNIVYRPSKYDGWKTRYDHNKVDHVKLSFLEE